MRQPFSHIWRGLVAFAFAINFLFPSSAFAVVGDVTLTGLPPNTTVSLTNEETKETVEQKTDDRGFVVIPLTGKNWNSGRHSVTCQVDGKPVTTTVALKDGPNRIDLSSFIAKSIPKKDFRLSDPIRTPLPETSASETAGNVAKGLVGGLLGGLFGGGGREEGPELAAKPPYPQQTLTSPDGKTKVNLSGVVEGSLCQIVAGVEESPGNGAPHLIALQDRNGNVLLPKEVAVYEIWEVWGGWRMTVSWTKSYYQDGRLVKQERGGWTAGWTEFLGRYKSPGEIPAIWKDFGGKPFEGIRGVIADFDIGQGFNPADWNLVVHATTRQDNFIVTQPFVTTMTPGNLGVLSFMQRERTFWETALR